MKKNLWIILAAAISTGVLAQDASNSAPVLQAPPPEPTPMTTSAPPAIQTPPPAPVVEAPTNAPTAPAPKKKTAKKKTTKKTTVAKKKTTEPELKTVPLVSGPATVSANHVNVRSKAGLVGEVLTHLTNGEPVTVVEEIHLKKSGPDEPSAWAKILLPGETHVWVKSSLLDANNAVTPKKLNLRAGPGENYGVVGTVEKGTTVQTVETKGEWTEIQAPTNAYAFVAAQYLKQGEEAPTVAAATPATPATPEAAPTTTTMPEMPTMAPAAAGTPGATESSNATPAMAEAPTAPTLTAEPTPPAAPEPPPERIVSHEGLVRGTFSIQAPTKFELISQDTKEPIDYLFTTSTNLDLSRYKGMHIIVTGEEALDARWGNTPVITIQKIQVID